MPTPTFHNAANKDEIAKTVLMPGDPLRAKFIAENFLEDVNQFTSIRNIYGYTGYYQGKRVSVMASGMGIPSMGIYSYELFNFYDVDNIIRIGTAASIDSKLPLFSLVLGIGACTDSAFGNQFKMAGTIAPVASYKLLNRAAELAKQLDIPHEVGLLFTTDTFYLDEADTLAWNKMGVLAVDMEAAGLYMNAMHAKKNALCICSITDNLVTGENCTVEERERSLVNMIKLGLETAE